MLGGHNLLLLNWAPLNIKALRPRYHHQIHALSDEMFFSSSQSLLSLLCYALIYPIIMTFSEINTDRWLAQSVNGHILFRFGAYSMFFAASSIIHRLIDMHHQCDAMVTVSGSIRHNYCNDSHWTSHIAMHCWSLTSIIGISQTSLCD